MRPMPCGVVLCTLLDLAGCPSSKTPATTSDAAGLGWGDAGILDASTAPDANAPDAYAPDANSADAAAPDAAPLMEDAGAVGLGCPSGVVCVSAFPFHHSGNTLTQPPGILDHYSCAPNTPEGGAETIYRVEILQPGFLSAAVDDGTGVDVDVHLLRALDPTTCVDRGDHHARAHVEPGFWYVVVDTYVSAGMPQAGAYDVDIGFLTPSLGACDMQTGSMARVGDQGAPLSMPATGPVVLEAHLVTQEEPAPYPTSATDKLAEHYTLSQARTGLVMHRNQVWAPLEGGGAFYGAGIDSPTRFPTVDEGWYVNMYWTGAARPPAGTRLIIRQPNGGAQAVVAAAGYETGPGDLSFIGGTPEESHFYLGTQHGSVLQFGIAVDQSLPLGPRTCQ